MSIYEQLAGGVRIVEAWPEVEQGGAYVLTMTPSQHALLWAFIWGHFGTAQLPKLVNESCAEH